MADQISPTDSPTTTMHPARAQRLQNDEDRIHPSKKERCPNCRKAHFGTCTAVPCGRCQKIHLPDLDWCHRCQKCGSHATNECTKRPQRSQRHRGGRLGHAYNTSTQGSQAGHALLQTGNIIRVADMTPTQWQDFLDALRTGFQAMPATARTGGVSKRPSRSQRAKKKKQFQAMKDSGDSKSQVVVKKEDDSDGAGGSAGNVAIPSGAMAA